MKLAPSSPPPGWREETDPLGEVTVLTVGRGAGLGTILGWTGYCWVILLFTSCSPFFTISLGLLFGLWFLGVVWLLVEIETWHLSPSRMAVCRGLFSRCRSRKVFRNPKLLVTAPIAGSASLALVDQGITTYLRCPLGLDAVLSLAALLGSRTGWTIDYTNSAATLEAVLDAATDPPDLDRLQFLLAERSALPLLAQLVSAPGGKPSLVQLLRECNATRRSLEVALGDPDPAVRGAAIDLLVRLGDREALPSIRQLFHGDEPGVRLRAVRALGALRDPEALPLLSRALSRMDEISPAAARALGLIGNPEAVPLLCDALRDAVHRTGRDWSTGKEAATALGRLEDRRGVEALCDALSEGDPSIREAAAAALGEIGDAAAVPQLCQVLQARNTGVAAAAATALGKIGDERAIEPLCQAVQTAEATARGEAALALGRFGGLPAIEVLIQALSDTEWRVRSSAATALGAIAVHRATPPIQIRAALPLLTRSASMLSAERAEVRNTCREAAQQIEARTAEIKGLPLPAGPGQPTTDTLPRVADAGEASSCASPHSARSDPK